MSSMLLNSISYTPQYINKAYFGSRSCSGASGCTFTTLYQGIVGIPQKYIRALNGFETTGSDTLDISFTQVFSSDRTTITFLNSVTQFNTIYFALILTNDGNFLGFSYL